MSKKEKSILSKASPSKLKKGLKEECCKKYLKKGEHKRCKRCPCFDMSKANRLERFNFLELNLEF
ncbi:hypothetical protein [Aequorivita sp. CIP111184]|uniref:hypothetical protein n=1 Tax=Aequorivita sp. CIP111184 TaxID=2211356 RepID=UPI000DCF82D1|nr:hypothetical protein [Aequorivita sp. CIP111184]